MDDGHVILVNLAGGSCVYEGDAELLGRLLTRFLFFNAVRRQHCLVVRQDADLQRFTIEAVADLRMGVPARTLRLDVDPRDRLELRLAIGDDGQ